MNTELRLCKHIWVYIIEENSGRYTVGITAESIKNPDAGIASVTSGIPPGKIVFYRHFTDRFSALGYYSTYKKLSGKSISNLMARCNPSMKDRSAQFREEISSFVP